jgi:hypothetical protein
MKKFLGGILIAVGTILALFGSGLLSLGLFRTGEVAGLAFIAAGGALGIGLLLAIAGDVLMDTHK